MIEGHRGVKTASPSHFLPPPGRNLSEKERDRENRAESKSRRTGCERRREDDKNRSFSREREREKETEGQVPGGVRQKSEEKTEGWREKEA